MTETSPTERSPDRHRRRPFATLVKKLRNFKSGSSAGEDSPHGSSSKRGKHLSSSTKKRPSANNNPYPESGRIGNGTPLAAAGRIRHRGSARSLSTAPTSGVASSAATLERTLSLGSSTDGRAPLTAGARSTAPTVSTDQEGAHSLAAPSHCAGSSVTGTSRTATGGVDSRRGGDSTFSSPAPSVRSLTTTLTTIQSMPMTNQTGATHQPAHGNGGLLGLGVHGHGLHGAGSNSIHFNQPFPSTPASAIPSHLAPASAAGAAPHGGVHNPTTYSTATANGLLTDNASILTLASSSKRRRRRSLDTNASVRALAPSSLFGGSRESLPLSVLSATVDGAAGGGPSAQVGGTGGTGAGAGASVPAMPPTPGGPRSNAAAAERAGLYSAAGVIVGDRNSFYAPKQPIHTGSGSGAGLDGASVRSGLHGHNRAESVNGSVAGLASPLVSPMEVEETAGQGEEEKSNLKAPDEKAVTDDQKEKNVGKAKDEVTIEKIDAGKDRKI